jgi:hypothetical protein
MVSWKRWQDFFGRIGPFEFGRSVGNCEAILRQWWVGSAGKAFSVGLDLLSLDGVSVVARLY